MTYVPPIIHRPETREYDVGYESTFGRKCRGCKGTMDGEPSEAVWCSRCKDPKMTMEDFEKALQQLAKHGAAEGTQTTGWAFKPNSNPLLGRKAKHARSR